MEAVAAPSTFADLAPDVRLRAPALVLGFALLTATTAQITLLLSWDPEP